MAHAFNPRQRQVDLGEFETSVIYREISRQHIEEKREKERKRKTKQQK